MQIKSTYRNAHISAFKAREVTRAIQGLPIAAALDILAFSPKKAAPLVAKTLKSAIANAENNNGLRVDTLVVKEATVGEGQTSKRFQPKARGSAGPILKRSSHIRIVVTDEIAIETRATRGAAKSAKVAEPVKAAEPAKKAAQPKAAPKAAKESTAEEPAAKKPAAKKTTAKKAAPKKGEE